MVFPLKALSKAHHLTKV